MLTRKAVMAKFPVTGAVLEWAIRESGFSIEDLASSIEVSSETLAQWIREQEQPTVSEARRLAAKLRRPVASLLLPSVPEKPTPQVEFRKPKGEVRPLAPEERRYIRRAHSLQKMVRWMRTELGEQAGPLPRVALADDTEKAAKTVRDVLGVSVPQQWAWTSASIAFDQWRERIESMGIGIFLFPIGKRLCRGFSIADDVTSVLAINTAWNEQARIFTMFHELGHILTRTSSVCVESPVRYGTEFDSPERWCERFAAAVLMPREAIIAFVEQQAPHVKTTASLAMATRIANRFLVSRPASVLRLIELGFAGWDLFEQLPPAIDDKTQGGGSGGGRDALEIRSDQLGRYVPAVFRKAVDSEVMSRGEALSYLDTTDTNFDALTDAGAR